MSDPKKILIVEGAIEQMTKALKELQRAREALAEQPEPVAVAREPEHDPGRCTRCERYCKDRKSIEHPLARTRLCPACFENETRLARYLPITYRVGMPDFPGDPDLSGDYVMRDGKLHRKIRKEL